MRKKLEFQYYYKQNGCQAERATDTGCICWHDEGTGPFKDERHDSDTPLVDWRIKPANAKLTRGAEEVEEAADGSPSRRALG